jgi:N-acetylmuramidase
MTQLGKGRAAAIAPAEMAALADELGCHPADLEAIAEVESGGFGWYRDGRIKVLFEKHWFFKLVAAELRATAVKRGLARRSWVSPSNGGYRDQKTPDQRYAILAKAIDLDREAAFASVSIGRFQIMGFNYKICGFPSASVMWTKFLDSERDQLHAFANFLKSKGLVAAIRRRDFAQVEKRYNGGGLAGAYARRMRTESERLRAGKWRNYQPGSMEVDPTSAAGISEPAPAPQAEPAGEPGKIEAAPDPVAMPERDEPNGLFLFLLDLIDRFLFNRRTNWAPFKDDDEVDLHEFASCNKRNQRHDDRQPAFFRADQQAHCGDACRRRLRGSPARRRPRHRMGR